MNITSNAQAHKDIITILDLIQVNHPDAIVAGGAVRDLFLGEQVKDIDVYIKCDSDRPETFLDQYWWNELKMTTDGDIGVYENADYLVPSIRGDSDPDPLDHSEDLDHSETPYGDSGINNVLEGYKDGIEINIILLTVDPIEFVDDYFDIGLCKAYFDGKRFIFTRDFAADVSNNTLTIVGKYMTKSRLTKTLDNHVPRIQKKYPMHQTKVADCNKHLLENG